MNPTQETPMEPQPKPKPKPNAESIREALNHDDDLPDIGEALKNRRDRTLLAFGFAAGVIVATLTLLAIAL